MATETELWFCEPRVRPVYQLVGTIRPQDVSQKELTIDELRRWMPIGDKYESGEIADLKELPSQFIIDASIKNSKILPDYFQIFGYSIFSEKIVRTIEEFNLDGARFSEVCFYNWDNITVRNKEKYFTIAFGTARSWVDLANSTVPLDQFRKTRAGTYVTYGSRFAHDALCAKRSENAPPDLWTDTCTPGGFFFSQQLKEALERAGLASEFALISSLWI